MTIEENIKEMESAIRDILNPYNDRDIEIEAWRLVEHDGWRKHETGTWQQDDFKWKCSCCGKRTDLPHYEKVKFCFNCGAEMLKE